MDIQYWLVTARPKIYSLLQDSFKAKELVRIVQRTIKNTVSQLIGPVCTRVLLFPFKMVIEALGKLQKRFFFSGPATKRGEGGKGLATNTVFEALKKLGKIFVTTKLERGGVRP